MSQDSPFFPNFVAFVCLVSSKGHSELRVWTLVYVENRYHLYMCAKGERFVPVFKYSGFFSSAIDENAKNLTGEAQEVVGSRESAAPFDRLTANKHGGYTGREDVFESWSSI